MAILFIDTWQAGVPRDKDVVPCELTEPSEFPHARFWAIQRAPRGQFGQFMCFSINNEIHVIDASVPTHVGKLPRDAVEITGELREKILHCKCGSHTWGCLYLREVKAILKPMPGGVKRFGSYQ